MPRLALTLIRAVRAIEPLLKVTARPGRGTSVPDAPSVIALAAQTEAGTMDATAWPPPVVPVPPPLALGDGVGVFPPEVGADEGDTSPAGVCVPGDTCAARLPLMKFVAADCSSA